MIVISTTITKIIDIMAIIIDLEDGTDRQIVIGHVMEITEVTMIAGGKATKIGTTGEMMMMVKPKITTMTETIEAIDLGEIEMTEVGEVGEEEEVVEEVAEEEAEEVAVMVETGMTMMMKVTTILKTEDADKTMNLKKAKNQRRERFIFRQNNLMMKISYSETMYQWG